MERLSEKYEEGDGDSLDTSPDNNLTMTVLQLRHGSQRERERELRPPKTTWRRTIEKLQNRVAVLERGVHCSARQELIENTCGGPRRHLGARGQVKVTHE